MKNISCLFIFLVSLFLVTGLCQASMTILTSASPDHTISPGSDEKVYGTSASNRITIECGAKAELINFPGQNVIEIQADSNRFTVSRSGTVVTFEGSDGTLLRISATNTAQIIDFADRPALILSIHNNQVMLDDQVIETEAAPLLSQIDLANQIIANNLDKSVTNAELPIDNEINEAITSSGKKFTIAKDEYDNVIAIYYGNSNDNSLFNVESTAIGLVMSFPIVWEKGLNLGNIEEEIKSNSSFPLLTQAVSNIITTDIGKLIDASYPEIWHIAQEIVEDLVFSSITNHTSQMAHSSSVLSTENRYLMNTEYSSNSMLVSTSDMFSNPICQQLRKNILLGRLENGKYAMFFIKEGFDGVYNIDIDGAVYNSFNDEYYDGDSGEKVISIVRDQIIDNVTINGYSSVFFGLFNIDKSICFSHVAWLENMLEPLVTVFVPSEIDIYKAKSDLKDVGNLIKDFSKFIAGVPFETLWGFVAGLSIPPSSQLSSDMVKTLEDRFDFAEKASDLSDNLNDQLDALTNAIDQYAIDSFCGDLIKIETVREEIESIVMGLNNNQYQTISQAVMNLKAELEKQSDFPSCGALGNSFFIVYGDRYSRQIQLYTISLLEYIRKYYGEIDDPSPTGCGAFINGEFREFDCYNLGAIGKRDKDPWDKPSWKLIGGYWQWGRKGPEDPDWYNTNTEHFAHGPTGPDSENANSWSVSAADDFAWRDSDGNKTGDDPCPDGFRVPTIDEWRAVLNDTVNNPQRTEGSWSTTLYDNTNYSAARFFGSDLMLPAATAQYTSRSGIPDYYSYLGNYWSSSESSVWSSTAWHLWFSGSGVGTSEYNSRLRGLSVRCISEE